jgi:hypothetical protein
MSEQFTKYERTWIDGLNRGDVSVADNVFAPNCVIHIAGSPEPNLSVSGFKQMLRGLLAAFPDIRLSERQAKCRSKQESAEVPALVEANAIGGLIVSPANNEVTVEFER